MTRAKAWERSGSAALARGPAAAVVGYLILAAFWAVSLHRLDVVPPVYEDEPWQASTAAKLATEGAFGSDLFAGFYQTEHRYYGFLPLHPLLLAAVFRFAGLGLFQARFEAVAMGLLTLALTFALGRRLFGAWIGALAVVCLVFVRWTGLTYLQPTGIPLLDLARVARYDIVVPVFGLAALHVYLSARRRQSPRLALLAGLLAGLAGLAHLYGAFWLPALLALALWDHGRRVLRRPTVYLLAAGFLLAWLPYFVYVATDLPAFRGQSQIYVEEGRFELLNPAWYWQNLWTEPRRYGPGLGPPGWPWLLRIGFWSAAVGLPLALGALAARAVWRGDPAARAVIVPLIVLAGLDALLLRLKLVNYTLTLAPLAAVVGAWGLIRLWCRISAGPWASLGRLALAVLCLAILVEGGSRIAAREAAAAQTTPYAQFIGRVREQIPQGARILALHNYWLGLDEYDFRAFWVPLRWTDPSLVPDPVPFDVALDRVAPDVVLSDPRWRGFLDESAQPGAPTQELAAAFWRWMERREARLVARIEDSTYGPLDVYRVRRPDGDGIVHPRIAQ